MPSISARSDVWHYDGESALRRAAVLEADGAAFRLIEPTRTTGPFAFADLIARDVSDGVPSYTLKRNPGWRIGFAGDIAPEIAAALPGAQRYGGVIDRIGLWPAAAAFAVLAAITVAIVLRTPALVARLVPASVEKRMGDLMVGDFGRSDCQTADGDAALAALVRRVDPHDPALEVHIVKLPVVNAVTLPGGRIVLFDGLVQAARSPDEVAGVIGHEIGHVRNRDVMESLLRQVGLSVLLGGMQGDIGGYTNALLAASYSRAAETRADAFAAQLLKDARIAPGPTADFFRRLGGKSDKAERMFAYVASHPVSRDRAARFAKGASGATTPALDARQWQALRAMCAASPKEVRGWRF